MARRTPTTTPPTSSLWQSHHIANRAWQYHKERRVWEQFDVYIDLGWVKECSEEEFETIGADSKGWGHYSWQSSYSAELVQLSNKQWVAVIWDREEVNGEYHHWRHIIFVPNTDLFDNYEIALTMAAGWLATH